MKGGRHGPRGRTARWTHADAEPLVDWRRRVWPSALALGLMAGLLIGGLAWREYAAKLPLVVEQAQVIKVVSDPPGLHCPPRAGDGRRIWFYVAAPPAGLPQFFTYPTCGSESWQIGEVVPLMRERSGRVWLGSRLAASDVAVAFFGAALATSFLTYVVAKLWPDAPDSLRPGARSRRR